MQFELNKTYKIRPRQDPQARWFVFIPSAWVESQSAWRGKSATNHDLILYAKELADLDIVEVFENHQPRCDCGALKARTTHASWCSLLIATS